MKSFNYDNEAFFMDIIMDLQNVFCYMQMKTL